MHVMTDTTRCRRMFSDVISADTVVLVYDGIPDNAVQEMRAAGIALRRSGRPTFVADCACPA